MKRKLLLAALCVVGALGFNANAQEDVTSTFLKNADLSDASDRTNKTSWTTQTNVQDWQTNGAVAVVEFYSDWNNGVGGATMTQKDFELSQSVTLPAGDYRIAVNAFYRNGDGDGTNPNKAWIFAGTKTQNVVALTSAGVGAYSGSSDLYKAATAFSQGDFSNAFDFSLESETTIDLGFKGNFTTTHSWCILGPVKLYKYSLDDYLVDYRAKVSEAEALYSSPMNAGVLSALQSAVVDESTFNLSSEVTAAIATLTTAITNANNSIANYASLKSVIDAYDAKATLLDADGTSVYNTNVADAKDAYENRTATDGAAQKAAVVAAFNAGVLATQQPGDGLDMTAYITNPTVDGDTGWTTERPKGGNGPLINNTSFEYWAGNANPRSEGSFNYYQELNNLPQGAYTISADMYNSLNGESGTDYHDGQEGEHPGFSATSGVYGLSSNEEVALVTTDGTTLQTYTTGEVLVFRGKMTIGVKNIVTPMAARWFVADNFKLTYARPLTAEEIAANTPPESISLEPTSANLTVYDETTFVPTILPETAGDKTVTWTSSNEAVATVNNSGVVTAVGVGSATITATANGADGVFTTATVTVSDVTPATAAPSFYSEIAEGDFYIMNAATGKFLGGANDWGTHASIIEHGIPFTVALSNGKYTLDSHTYNDANSHFVNGAYIDGASAELVITPVADGKYTISTGETSGYYSAFTTSTYVDTRAVNPNSALAQWYFLSKTDRDKMLAAATSGNPVDATYYIKEANISRNLRVSYDVSGWTGIAYGEDKNQSNANYNAQVWNGSVNVSQEITGIPNGTYTLKMQGFSSGTDVKLKANNAEVALLAQPSNINSQSGAATAFTNGEYVNTLDVTVTDRTLTISLTGDCSGAKWLCYDNFELYMTEYTANTGIIASIDDDEIEVGKTAKITATTDPATASFNALTFTSSNNEVATVDEDGVVTAVAEGEATITITANEMEDFSETIDVTVTLTSVDMTVKAGKYGTFVAPFEVTIPDGIEAYKVTGLKSDNETLNMESVTTTIPANTPVVLKNQAAENVNETFTGKSTATEDSYTVGLLTGVYTESEVPEGSYVLQTQGGVQGFYQVEGSDFTAIPNRAYLTVPATSGAANVRALFFPADGEATGIEAIGVLTSGNYDAIYTANGVKVNSLQKGLNIVVKDGKSYKIFVK